MARRPPHISPRSRAEILVAINAGVLSLDEVLSLAASSAGEDLRSLPLRDVLENLPGVNTASILARLRDFGCPDVESVRLGDAINTQNLSFLADAFLANNSATLGNWPFVERTS